MLASMRYGESYHVWKSQLPREELNEALDRKYYKSSQSGISIREKKYWLGWMFQSNTINK
ncbi:hypothetical protein [Fredinandcohnia quinoae]|uniref:Uncharacterized protein n=1 Tax=Fredinandcohnia quinoae TaxID=2918902 RepID=A0AAW5E7K2_9BACI|nr:hypothetical protein [Fredinandcohnia sp. SECRCQ15]MCH1626899.1 hypothetical protein [Fredinandcohnia sp. SECRCQ15]